MCKYTNEEAQRRGYKKFCLTLTDLEKIIGLQYASGIYGKGHPEAFFVDQGVQYFFFFKYEQRPLPKDFEIFEI